MSDFVSWCRHLLVPFFFHEVTSLHPPSFDFSTCSTHFSFFRGIFVFAPRARRFMHAHAHADNAPPFTRMLWRRSVSAHEEPHDLP